MIVTIALTAAGTIPDFRLDSAVALAPMTSISVAIREVLCDTVSWSGLVICVLVHLMLSGWLLWASREKLIPPVEFRGARADDQITEQRRNYLAGELPWVFGIMFAAMLTIPANIPELNNLTGQLIFVQGMMVLAPAGMLWRHGISLRQGLRLNPVSAKALVAAILLMPLMQMCATSIAWVLGEFLPIPQEVVKQMQHLQLPADQPTWVLVVMIALTPAICEELAFRGALLYSLSSGGPAAMNLRKRLKVSALVGLAFGCFHTLPVLANGIPTGVLGAILAFLALETGSILPGMIAHFGNNAVAVLAQRQNLELDTLPPWAWAASWAALILIFVWLRKGNGEGNLGGDGK
jgi:sodium transport system permease protein